MFEFFVIVGIPWMTFLTINLLALLLAAWKAPAWVKEIGMIALVVGVIWALLGFFVAAEYLARTTEGASQSVIWAGMKIMVIPLMYGLIIYLVSLFIRIIQKPRI